MKKEDIQPGKRYKARVYAYAGHPAMLCSVEVICRAKRGGGWKVKNLTTGGHTQVALASQFQRFDWEW